MSVITPDIQHFSPEEGREEWDKLMSAAAWVAMEDVVVEEVDDPALPPGQEHYKIIHTTMTPKLTHTPGNIYYEAAKPYLNMASNYPDK